MPTPQGDKDGIRKLNEQTTSQVPRKRLATWPAPVGWGVTRAVSPGQKAPGSSRVPRGAWDARQRALPLHGPAGVGTQQVLEKTLDLRVPEGLQAAGGPDGDIPGRPLRCSLQRPASRETPEAGLACGLWPRPEEAGLGPCPRGTHWPGRD